MLRHILSSLNYSWHNTIIKGKKETTAKPAEPEKPKKKTVSKISFWILMAIAGLVLAAIIALAINGPMNLFM